MKKKILRLYKDLSIKKKLLLAFYIQIIIPMIFMGFLSYRSSEETVKRISMNYAQDMLQMIELRFQDFINNLNIISQDLLYDKKIYNILNQERGKDPLIDYEAENEISNTIKKIVLSRPEVQSIAIISNKGKFFYADDNSRSSSIRTILPYADILEKARQHEGKATWYTDSQNGSVNNIYLVRTIYNQDDFSEIGLQVILVKKEFLETIYKGLTKSMRNVVIVSEKNELIASRINEDWFVNSGSLRNLQNERDSRIDNDLKAMVSHTTISDTGWKVITYIPLSELFRDANALGRNIIVFSVITVLILSMFNLAIAMGFINPINRLVKGMKMVQKDNRIVYIDDERNDEIGFLNQTFNEMSREINHLVTWVYREQITRKEAELKALQSQINPHFLFNTLESINWMAQLNNVPEISRIVTDLSDLMEASIGRDDRLITVEEEFKYSDKYISLLKARFEDKIEFEKEISDGAGEVKIPRLLIQPLVENAVYHGIEKLRGKGKISLKAFIENDMLVIIVMDSGPGIDGTELSALNRMLSMDNDSYFKMLGSKHRKSIGIENVNRRIKLFYGDKYGVKIESEQGSFTKVIVNIPLNWDQPAEGYYVQSYNN
ncbi:MAG TPA: two-component sensor histidine kinase [Ruminiclostridium sp.]|jgi:two-component system sensor histidine kinase YesM|nr:sensor histidine kinase [Clostridiaceae bacterium]HAA25931.1 two-component sensor histidine kinase [Ruminiclostridium sp.]